MNISQLKTLLIFFASFSLLSVHAQDRPIRIATFAIVAPISFNGQKGPEGFDIDLINAIAKVENMNIQIRSYPFYAMADGLNNEKIDLVVSGVFFTPQRDRIFELSKSYLSAKDSILYMNPNLKIEKDEDLKTLKIAALEHSTQLRDLINVIGVPKENIVPVKTTYLGYRAMMTHQVDAVATYGLSLRYLVKDKAGEYKFYTLQTIEPRHIVAIAKKGNKDLIAMFNHGVNLLKENGTYQKIYDKWIKN